MAVPQNHLPYQMPPGELVKSHEFARDFLKIRFYCGTAIAVPYGFYRWICKKCSFQYARQRFRLRYCSRTSSVPKGEGIGCDLIRRADHSDQSWSDLTSGLVGGGMPPPYCTNFIRRALTSDQSGEPNGLI